MTYTLQNSIGQTGYSPDQKLFLALITGDSNIFTYNGLAYTPTTPPSYLPVVDDTPTAFAFTSDTSHLIVGTLGGVLCVYPIVNDVLTAPCIQTSIGENKKI